MKNYRELKRYRSLQFSPENRPKTHEGKPNNNTLQGSTVTHTGV